jgi:hypothetical protein
MTTTGKKFRRLLAAAAVLASLTLSGCEARRDYSGSGDVAPPSAFFGWGSGWGGNREWGGGWGEDRSAPGVH